MASSRGRKRTRVDVTRFVETKRQERAKVKGDKGVCMNFADYILYHTGKHPLYRPPIILSAATAARRFQADRNDPALSTVISVRNDKDQIEKVEMVEVEASLLPICQRKLKFT